jgi:hypothetical protein
VSSSPFLLCVARLCGTPSVSPSVSGCLGLFFPSPLASLSAQENIATLAAHALIYCTLLALHNLFTGGPGLYQDQEYHGLITGSLVAGFRLTSCLRGQLLPMTFEAPAPNLNRCLCGERIQDVRASPHVSTQLCNGINRLEGGERLRTTGDKPPQSIYHLLTVPFPIYLRLRYTPCPHFFENRKKATKQIYQVSDLITREGLFGSSGWASRQVS